MELLKRLEERYGDERRADAERPVVADPDVQVLQLRRKAAVVGL